MNEGHLDRAVRLVLAVAAIIAAIYTTGVLQVVLIVVAGIMWGTAASGECLLYLPFHIDTRSKK